MITARKSRLFVVPISPAQCSLWTYMTGDVLAITAVAVITYWPVLLLLIVVAGLTGYSFARGARHDVAL